MDVHSPDNIKRQIDAVIVTDAFPIRLPTTDAQCVFEQRLRERIFVNTILRPPKTTSSTDDDDVETPLCYAIFRFAFYTRIMLNITQHKLFCVFVHNMHLQCRNVAYMSIDVDC